MAQFANLSNELVIAISTNLRKPADILHLCIAERRSYQIIIPLLYENITLHHLDYPTHDNNLYGNVCCLWRLFDQQARNSKSGDRPSTNYGRECRSLAVYAHRMLGFPNSEVFQLLPFLPALRKLSIISTRAPLEYEPRHKFQVWRLEQALRPLCDTLESLTLFIGRDSQYCSRDGIGSLLRLKALKQLHIQSHILIGWDERWHRNATSGLLLSQILPPKLEHVTIHCCVLTSMIERGEIVDHVETRLSGEVFNTKLFESSERWMERDRRVIDSVVVCVAQDLNHGHPKDLTAGRLTRLNSCFDIIGRKTGSVDQN